MQKDNKDLLPNSYIALDLEMTGLSNKNDKIIEIALVDVVDGEIVKRFNTLVNPNRDIDEEISKITGIKNDMVKDMPYIEDVIDEVLSFSDNKIWIGHNISIDYGFIKRVLINKYGKKYKDKYIFNHIQAMDTLKICRSIMPPESDKRLASALEFFGIKCINKHRALSDCINTHLLYQSIRNEILKGKIKAELSGCFYPSNIYINMKQDKLANKKLKESLKKIISYYKIESDVLLDKLTNSEAVRLIHKIQSVYGIREVNYVEKE